MDDGNMPPHVPVLETARLVLRPFAARHLTPAYLAWLSDPEVVRYSENRHRRHTRESCADYWRSMCEGGHPFWAVEWKERGGLHIGNLTAYLDRPNRVADLAIMIGAPEARGHGLGLEAWRAALDHLLGPDGGLRKVTAGTMAANRAMLRVMAASGMVEEGRRRRHFLLDGAAVDMVMAARFAQTEEAA
jgi:RimJ/RimL family protein N-acetyltransferase